ncbi:MAG TPA: hypothetical protein VFU36_05915, partial [Jatrophihabitans sp.]|nr:hypothetical protein [Jatrophihabitans sp.]
ALSFRWERAHRAIHKCTEPAEYQNMLSSWSFCAAIVLPVKLAACVIIVAAIAEWPARNVIGQAPAYRYVYSTAATLVAAAAAHCCTRFSLPVAVPTGALAYLALSLTGVVLAMLAVGQRAEAIAFLKPTTHRIEVATISIAIAAIAVLHSPWPAFAWLSLPATIALQRHAVRTDLHAVEDPAARPMNSDAWLLIAREVIAACSVGAVMRVDTADPAAVSYLARVQAGCDAIGMAGDSGLAVLLTECPAPNAEALAVRLRSVLHRQGIPAQVAVAAKPRDGQSLDDLLAVSEAELIARVAATREARSDSPEA